MDLTNFALLCALAGFGGLVGGFLSGLVLQFRVASLEREVNRLYHLIAGEAGNVARVQKNERMNAALVEAAALFKEGKKPEEILKELLPKYPDVALQLGQKGLKGKLGGILG